MATSAQPITPSDTLDSSQPSPDSSSQVESQSQPTQQTSTQTVPPTKDRYTELLEATLREQNQRLQAMQTELQTRQAPAPPTTDSPASDPAAFFNNPQGELEKFRRQINEDLQRTVQPLLELGRGLRGEGTPYGNLKQQFMNDSRYAQVLSDPKVAFAVDEIMKQQQPTPELMKAAIIQASGLKMTGELDLALVASGVDISRFGTPATPPPSQASTPAPVPVPAHMRPTAPAAPVPQNTAPAAMPLTELEKRIARERNMTDEQYRAWLTLPASEVASSQIGRPAK